jgi:hypothetical protein
MYMGSEVIKHSFGRRFAGMPYIFGQLELQVLDNDAIESAKRKLSCIRGSMELCVRFPSCFGKKILQLN